MTEVKKFSLSPKELAAKMLADLTGGDSVEVAVREGRCLKAPMGCGGVIKLDRAHRSYDFPNPGYQSEWKLTGLCSACQDTAALLGDEENVIVGTD